MRTWLLGVGFVSLLGQVTLLRELAVASYGVELVYALALGVWLLGSALGAAVLGRIPPRLGWLLLAVLLPVSAVLLRGARGWLDAVPGAYLPLPTQLLLTVLAVVPTAMLAGALFPAAAKGEPSLAKAYAIESMGGVAGGLVSAALLAAGVSNWLSLLLSAEVALGMALLPWRERPKWVLPLAVPLAVSLALAALADRPMTRWAHPALEATRDTPYGRVTIERRGSLVSVFANDALAFESDEADAEEFVNLAAVEHLSPKRVLVLGGATSGVVAEALEYGPEVVDAVELDEASHRLVAALLPEVAKAALGSPKVHLHFADPRKFVESSSERWDLVLVAMPEPASAATSRFYSREFYQSVQRRLAPGGVLAFRLPASENVWTRAQRDRVSAVLHALPFANVRALMASRLVVVASDHPLDPDAKVLAARLRERATSPKAATPEFLLYVHGNDRKAELEEVVRKAGSVEANTDERPVCYRHAALGWLAKVSQELAGTMDEMAGRSEVPWLALLVVAVTFAALRMGRRARPAGAAAFAGFAGMVLETGLLLHYQAKSGVLFQDVGLLLTLFMAGLAAGSWGVHRSAWKTSLVPVLVVVGAAVPTALVARWGVEAGLVGTGALLAVAGAGCGGLFAVFAEAGGRGLYAADLAGGCVGAVLASLVLFPLLGLSETAAALVPMAALAAVAPGVCREERTYP
ncbi:MAG: hypothetical protein QM765_28320 [Myxococcales bacterium]